MKLLILTTHFPYGTWNETFFEPELHVLAAAFDEIHVVPLKTGPLRRSLPRNVKVWSPIAAAGKWFYIRQFLHLSTWRMLSNVLHDCVRSVGISRQRFRNCLAASCLRSAFMRLNALRAFVKSGEPVIVYAYWGHFPALAIPFAKSIGALTCVRYHSVDIYLERDHNEGFIPWRDEIQAAADLNVFISEHGLKYFNDHAGSGVRGKRIVARLGSPDYGPPLPRSRGLDVDGPLFIVSVSSIGGVKRVHLIARLAKALAKNHAVEWHHFGSGQCSLLEKEISGGVPQALKVTMWGERDRDEIQRFYRVNPVTFFVNLSQFEGVPVSIMESLNADIPVVASDVGANSEAVFDGRSGMLVERDDCERTEVLARKILNALQPGGLLYNSSPRKVWQELYDAQTNAARMVMHLRELAGR